MDEKTQRAWDEYQWPEWVPNDVRRQISEFWGSRTEGPDRWIANGKEQPWPIPEMGQIVRMREDECISKGRWIHCWNNMGRLVKDDGDFLYVSSNQWVRSDPRTERISVPQAQIEKVFSDLGKALSDAIKKKGNLGFIGHLEARGSLDEEVEEYRAAVHLNDWAKMEAELLDIAVVSIWELASIKVRTDAWTEIVLQGGTKS